MQVLYLGRALHTKETLPDFLKWRWVTRHPLVFRELTGSQRVTPQKYPRIFIIKIILYSGYNWAYLDIIYFYFCNF